jgi:hypothetical protein
MNKLLRRRTLLLAAGLTAGALASPEPALAQPAAPAPSGPRVIEMSQVAMPVTRDGRLLTYLFVTVRVDVAEAVDIWVTRERNHFLRDAVVRAAYRQPMANPDRLGELIEPIATNTFRAAVVEALGARAVRAVTIPRVYLMGRREPINR